MFVELFDCFNKKLGVVTNIFIHVIKLNTDIDMAMDNMTPSESESGRFAVEMEEEASHRIFPVHYYEKHLLESIRPDARHLSHARHTTVSFGPVGTADGSALVKIGDTVSNPLFTSSLVCSNAFLVILLLG